MGFGFLRRWGNLPELDSEAVLDRWWVEVWPALYGPSSLLGRDEVRTGSVVDGEVRTGEVYIRSDQIRSCLKSVLGERVCRVYACREKTSYQFRGGIVV